VSELCIRVGGGGLGNCQHFEPFCAITFSLIQPGSLHGVDPNIDDRIELDPETLMLINLVGQECSPATINLTKK